MNFQGFIIFSLSQSSSFLVSSFSKSSLVNRLTIFNYDTSLSLLLHSHRFLKIIIMLSIVCSLKTIKIAHIKYYFHSLEYLSYIQISYICKKRYALSCSHQRLIEHPSNPHQVHTFMQTGNWWPHTKLLTYIFRSNCLTDCNKTLFKFSGISVIF